MILLKAPYPAIDVVTVLPNPQFNDFEHRVQESRTKRMMDGTTYTYIESGDNRQLSMEFSLTKQKKLELRAFLREHNASKILLLDHNNQHWVLQLVRNPFEFSGRVKEVSLITLVFEGHQI